MKAPNSGHTRRHVFAIAAGAAGLACASAAQADATLDQLFQGIFGKQQELGGKLTEGEATAGLREALWYATGRTISRVGKRDGYLADRAIHIPLPGALQTAQKGLALVGASGQLDDLELRLNRAAEAAAPKASSIFRNAIQEMTVTDAIGIVRGPDDSATRYFQGKMTAPLTTAFRPIVAGELEDAGAFKTLEKAIKNSKARALAPAASDYARSDLIDHGLGAALGGLFHYLAVEEAAIRHDPVKRSTELLRRVFG